METTLLYGNGVNLLSGNGIEWKNLLMTVSGLDDIPILNNNTMLYEYIVLPLAVHLYDRDGCPLFFCDGTPFLARNESENEIKNRLKEMGEKYGNI